MRRGCLASESAAQGQCDIGHDPAHDDGDTEPHRPLAAKPQAGGNRAMIRVEDGQDPAPTFVSTSVISNELEDGLDARDQPDDIQEEDARTADREFKLRAERSGLGDGRIYTIVYTAFDAAGNSAEVTMEVHVPHDQGGIARRSRGFVDMGTGFDEAESRFALVLLTESTGCRRSVRRGRSRPCSRSTP